MKKSWGAKFWRISETLQCWFKKSAFFVKIILNLTVRLRISKNQIRGKLQENKKKQNTVIFR